MKTLTMKTKMKNIKARTLLLAAVGILMTFGGIAVAADDAGVPGAFQRYGSSARGLALGNAVVGMADDAAISYWNPAGLAQLRTMEVTAMGATMFNDTKYSFLALGMPTEKWGTFALDGVFTNSGDFERATWDEDLTETFSEKESILTLGWAGSAGRFAYGGAIKAVTQDMGGVKGSSMGLDLGIYFRPHRLLSVGAAVQNVLAPKITLVDEEEELATSGRIGLALRFFSNRMIVSSDLVKTKWMDTSVRAGLELWPIRSLALRGGYDSERENMSAGAGFRLKNWQFDYAYVGTELGAQNVVSATVRFGVPFGVKVSSDRALFSPSGTDREVNFNIETAVRGTVESWQVVITDDSGAPVRTLGGNGIPPEGVSWAGDDEDGRLVGDGKYMAKVMIVDNMGQEWDYSTDVEVLGFKDRTRVPIRVEISGSSPNNTTGGSDQ